MEPEISVQICSYNRSASLKKCLEALFRQDFPAENYEIVLVDDGSPDDTGEMVKNLKSPVALNYLYQKNQGLATARNLGLNNVKGKYVLFVDDDIIAGPALLKEHARIHRLHPKTVVRGRVHHVADLDRPLHPGFTMADISTSFFWTSNVSVAREYLFRAGLFDTSYSEYGWEDLELGLRLRALGLVCRYNREALVFHLKPELKKADVEKKIAQARAKARMAVKFLYQHPILKVKMATGIHAPRFIWDNLLRLGGATENTCRKIMAGAPEGRLTGINRWAAGRLIDFAYFDTLRDTLKAYENQHRSTDL